MPGDVDIVPWFGHNGVLLFQKEKTM